MDYLTIIYTKFQGATDTKGSRIVATGVYFKHRKVTHKYLHEYDGNENHKTAAYKFLSKNVDADDIRNFELVGQADHPSGTGSAWVFKRVGC